MATRSKQTMEDAYFAGIIDADGCVTRSSGNVRVQVTNTRPELCEAFKERFGGSVYCYGGHYTHRTLIYSWQVSGRPARKILEAIRPYTFLKINKVLWGLLALDTPPRERETLLVNLVNDLPFVFAAATTEREGANDVSDATV